MVTVIMWTPSAPTPRTPGRWGVGMNREGGHNA